MLFFLFGTNKNKPIFVVQFSNNLEQNSMTAIQFNNRLLSLQDRLLFFAYSLTSNDDDARDLLQETLLKALMYKNQFADNTNFKAWVFTIMKNTFINSYRRNQKSRRAFDGTEDSINLAQNKIKTSETPDSHISVQEMEQKIEQLDDDFRVPFKMHTDGFKYKEIAEELDLPLGTVKSRIFFTRKKLQEALAQ